MACRVWWCDEYRWSIAGYRVRWCTCSDDVYDVRVGVTGCSAMGLVW